jgi:hypothetical protein
LPPWPVLVVDDDPQIHAMTRVLLRDFTFEGRDFAVISAHSAALGLVDGNTVWPRAEPGAARATENNAATKALCITRAPRLIEQAGDLQGHDFRAVAENS